MTINCKMCGCPNNVEEGQLVCTCTACGNNQTIPNIDNEKKALLFDRANAARMKCDFSKSFALYSQILGEYPVEAEAYFGLCLSKYGIEYVDDKKTNKKIPTCHRTLYNSIFDDVDYKEAIKYADVVAKRIYQSEAEVIDKIQKTIISLSQKETPFDIFICYKETTEDNQRTRDSYVAEDIYNELTKKGYKVFFSRITLESKLGQEYEPIIFNALQTSKIMLVIGSKAEYFNSAWVKNEWSRYLQFMEEQKGNKYMIPCFRDMEAYDMPEEFLPLQSQNLDKLGAKQDLIRAIDKIFGKDNVVKEKVIVKEVQNSNTNKVDSLLKRVKILLEDKDLSKADEILELVLNEDPECGDAYLYKFLIENNLTKEEDIASLSYLPLKDKYFEKAIRFSNESLKKRIDSYLDNIYKYFFNIAINYKNDKQYQKAIDTLHTIKEYKDATTEINNCNYLIKKDILNKGLVEKNNLEYQKAIEIFKSIIDFENAKELIEECNALNVEKEYQKAIEYMNNKLYSDAILLFKKHINYKDSKRKLKYCDSLLKEIIYQDACYLMEYSKLEKAIERFNEIIDYKDSKKLMEKCILIEKERKYNEACKEMKAKNFYKARTLFKKILGYKDSMELDMICLVKLVNKKPKNTSPKQSFNLKLIIICVIVLVIIIMIISSLVKNNLGAYFFFGYEDKASAKVKEVQINYTSSDTKKHIVVPEKIFSQTVTGILYGAFNGDEVESIILADSITYIENNAFSDCYNLESIKLSNNIKAINAYTFKECHSLKNIDIPNGVLLIDSYAFLNCYNLTKITIPNTVHTINKSGFLGCNKLDSVYFDGTIEEWNEITFGNEHSNPLTYAKHLYIKNTNNEYVEYINEAIE